MQLVKITNENKVNNKKITSNVKNMKSDSDENPELTFEEILLKEKSFSRSNVK